MVRGRAELSVIGMPPGRQIWPPWVQHPYAHRLQSRHHTNRVVISERAGNRTLECVAQARHSRECRVVPSARTGPVIACQNANVVACLTDELGHSIARLDMKVTELENGVTVKGLGRSGDLMLLCRSLIFAAFSGPRLYKPVGLSPLRIRAGDNAMPKTFIPRLVAWLGCHA
jgi:hypothetical protein